VPVSVNEVNALRISGHGIAPGEIYARFMVKLTETSSIQPVHSISLAYRKLPSTMPLSALPMTLPISFGSAPPGTERAKGLLCDITRGTNPHGLPYRIARLVIEAASSPSNRYLDGTYLNKANLKAVDFNAANLRYAQLDGALLHNANLQGTNLIGASLNNANLSGATLAHSLASRANFVGAKLQGANLSFSNMDRATFINPDLRGATCTGAQLRAANLTEANLKGADLSLVNQRHKPRKGLADPNFSQVILTDTTPMGANFSGSRFSNNIPAEWHSLTLLMPPTLGPLNK
jgi:hypothetical protein